MNKLFAIINRAVDFLIAYLREMLDLVISKDDEAAGE